MGELSLQLQAAGASVHLRLAQARGVLRAAALVRAPGAPASVLGAVQSGGQALPVLDLGRLLGGAPARGRSVVLADSLTGPVALAVDAVAGVAETSTPFDLDALLSPLQQPRLERDAPLSAPACTLPGEGATGEGFALFERAGRTVAVPLSRLAGVAALTPHELAAGRIERDGESAPLLSYGDGTGTAPARAALIDGRRGRFGLAVERVGPVVRPRAGRLEPAPPLLGPGLLGVLRLETVRLVAVLDVDVLEPSRPSSPANVPPAVESLVAAEGAAVLVFDGADRRWAVPAGVVAEVLRAPDLVRPPGAPPGVAGVVARAGELTPVLAAGPVAAGGGWIIRARLGRERIGLFSASPPRPGRLLADGAPRPFAPERLEDGGEATLIADDGSGGAAQRLLSALERARA
jgi:purine-binding chemotaxis protein CheW